MDSTLVSAPRAGESLKDVTSTVQVVDSDQIERSSARNLTDLLADTVGFIRHLPHKLVEAFRSTLEESSIPLLLEKHVMDATWKRVALSGFGVGLSWGSAIIYRP